MQTLYEWNMSLLKMHLESYDMPLNFPFVAF